MADQDDIRDDLDTEVFEVFGKEVTLNSLSSPTYNTRGEMEDVASVASTITIVPYNIIDSRQSYESFGNIEEGEMDAAIRYNIVVNIDDELVFEGDTWLIKDISPNYLPDNVVTIVRITRKHD